MNQISTFLVQTDRAINISTANGRMFASKHAAVLFFRQLRSPNHASSNQTNESKCFTIPVKRCQANKATLIWCKYPAFEFNSLTDWSQIAKQLAIWIIKQAQPITASSQQQPREYLHSITIQQTQNTLRQAEQTLQNINQLNSRPQSKQSLQKQEMEFNKSTTQAKQQPQQVQQKQQPPTISQQQPRPQSSIASKKNLKPSIDTTSSENLQECPEGCGRSFNEKALQKHAKICKKVFQQKRKEFNSAKQRIGEEVKKIDTKPRKAPNQIQKQQQQQQIPNKPKWKAQSEAFRAILRQNKGVQLTKEVQDILIYLARNPYLVQCRFCGRKFNESAAKKHVQFCENKSKENKIKQGLPQKMATQAPSKPAPLANNQKPRK